MGNIQGFSSQQIAELITPAISDAGLFLEEVRIGRLGKTINLQIIVDLVEGTDGVGSEQLDTVTRAISEILDEKDPIKDPYLLEVSSPGLERKLVTKRHFMRVIGRIIELKLTDGEKFEAEVTSVSDEAVTLIPITRVPKSAKIIKAAERAVKFMDIKRARQVISFSESGADGGEQ
ncbi:MAG: ribosome maturation factor RimP [Arcanobacterium sp.]|nr:ribosome maturation factor RimP [Arcanobacterium sp.]